MTILEVIVGLAISWLIWPGLMFMVALIGESRVLPIGKKQSMAFLPGDMALSMVVLNCYFFWNSESAPESESFWRSFTFNPWIVVVIGAAAFFIGAFLHISDCRNYPKRAANSPTKWTHDIMGYFILLTLIVWLTPATIFAGFNLFGVSNILCIVLYVLMVVWDALDGFDEEVVYARHPYDWKPIWRTKKIVHYEYHPQPDGEETSE